MSCHHAWWNHVILKSQDITINIPMILHLILYHSWGILMPSWFFWTKSHLNPKKKTIWRQITIQSYWNPVKIFSIQRRLSENRLPIKNPMDNLIMFPIIVNYPWRIHGFLYIYIYANMTGVYWWDPWSTIAAPWIQALGPGSPRDVQLLVLDLQLLKVDDVQVFCQPMGKDMAFRGKRCENDGKIMGKL